MRKIHAFIFCVLSLCVFNSCNEEEGVFPSLFTEFANLLTDHHGKVSYLVTDDGKSHAVLNRIEGLSSDSTYRVFCDYTQEEQGILIYQLQSVNMLADSTTCAVHDPVNVNSVWKNGEYINMHLCPLTQGGHQYWGFAIDSIAPAHFFISLHHKQGTDPTSYTRSLYASIHLDALQNIQQGDSITFHINTFDGKRQWNFTK